MARLQVGHTEVEASGGTIQLALTGVLSGSLLVIIAGHGDAGQLITGGVDDLSTVGVQAIHGSYGPDTNGITDIWYIANATAGTRTITVTFASAAVSRFLAVIEADGDASTPLDKTAKTDTADSANPSTPSVTPDSNGQYCIAVARSVPGTSLTATSPYGNVFAATAVGSGLYCVEDQVQDAAGPTNGAWTAVNGSWWAALATFQPGSPPVTSSGPALQVSGWQLGAMAPTQHRGAF